MNPDALTQVVGTLRSVNVGLPTNVPWQGKTVYSGIFKDPVQGGVEVRRTNIDGDGQGDLNGHGGEQRAVLVYQQEAYEHWKAHLGRDDLTPGMFGENFTVDGLADDTVCIGDRFQIGDATFEVSQPRVTCFRIGMRLGEPRMAALLVAHRRPGFYFRVIHEGTVRAGDPIVKVGSGPHQLTVVDTDALLYLPDRDETLLRNAVEIPALSPGWQQSFRELLNADPNRATAAGPTIGEEPAWNGFRAVPVIRLEKETTDVLSIYLAAGAGGSAHSLAGQYLTVRVPMPDRPAVRSYSISQTPDQRTYRISVKRDGLVSRWLLSNLRVGDHLDIAAPRGDFTLDVGREPVILISAGVGATPVIAMLHEIARTRRETHLWWIHVSHNQQDGLFRHEAGELLSRIPNSHTATFLTRQTDPIPGAFLGRPSLGVMRTLDIPHSSTAYICGPALFTTDMTVMLRELGLDPTRIRSELFSSRSPINPGLVDLTVRPPRQPAGERGTGSAITFSRSGLTARWRANDQSLLALAEACDVPTRWVCRSGVCHTCSTGLISGTVGYQPEPLEPPPAGEVLLCCAQPTDDLVLDI